MPILHQRLNKAVRPVWPTIVLISLVVILLYLLMATGFTAYP